MTVRGWDAIEAGLEVAPASMRRDALVRLFSGASIGTIRHLSKSGDAARVVWPNGTETLERTRDLQVIAP